MRRVIRGVPALVVAASAADVTVTKGADVIVVSSVQLVARNIELERADATCPATDLASDREGEEDDSPDCPDLRLGPCS